jgi:cytidylate kinase
MYKVETEIFSHLADNESCIVAGRTGFYVFRNHPNHLSILIQASMPFRVERVMRKQNMTEDEARKTIEKVDKMRENYVKKFTKTSRYDTRNYDLVISADNKTEDEIVDLIMEYIG